jgi:hypothetical protein
MYEKEVSKEQRANEYIGVEGNKHETGAVHKSWDELV